MGVLRAVLLSVALLSVVLTPSGEPVRSRHRRAQRQPQPYARGRRRHRGVLQGTILGDRITYDRFENAI